VCPLGPRSGTVGRCGGLAVARRQAQADRGQEAVRTAAFHFCCDRRRPIAEVALPGIYDSNAAGAAVGWKKLTML